MLRKDPKFYIDVTKYIFRFNSSFDITFCLNDILCFSYNIGMAKHFVVSRSPDILILQIGRVEHMKVWIVFCRIAFIILMVLNTYKLVTTQVYI